MPAAAPPRIDVSILIALAGTGLLGYGVMQWRALPSYGPADIDAATELNLGLDLSRAGGDPPPPERVAAMREAVRSEVLATIAEPRDSARSFIAAGALLVVFAALRRWLLQRLARRASAF